MVYPACAGIDPSLFFYYDGERCLPRMRGDRPLAEKGLLFGETFTPHARGSTYPFTEFDRPDVVYPACAGIDPLRPWSRVLLRSLPRMRGDRPFYAIIAVQQDGFTPHARGSTPPVRPLVQLCGVYPACAGIDPPLGTTF